ncbi:MAG: AgmX/PglI C-terminal domain-containing protein [Myxococcales bacterium]|nr:MAG: AgmX/PglI C-terminal domain-containing protein [Myxococcales bacterium]
MTKISITLAALSFGLVACSGSFALRSPDKYREDTQEVLATRQQQIESCYNVALANDKSLSGDVVVNFKVATETGAFQEATIVEEQTSAPEVLQNCVLGAIGDLMLEPADENPGIATFKWSFASSEG